jgi:hypothetical protein
MKMIRLALLTSVSVICIVIMLPGAAVADDATVYESLSDVPIGRVFFSPTQRIRLDKNRGVTQRSQTSSKATGAKRPKKDAAGFIISKSGLKQVYADGDFVETTRSTAVRFPGDVTVVRQPQVDEDSSDDRD